MNQSATVQVDSRLRLTIILSDGDGQTVQLDRVGAESLAEALTEYAERDPADGGEDA